MCMTCSESKYCETNVQFYVYVYVCMGICICELGHVIKYIYDGSQPNKIWNPLAPRMERELEKYNEEERQVLEKKV